LSDHETTEERCRVQRLAGIFEGGLSDSVVWWEELEFNLLANRGNGGVGRKDEATLTDRNGVNVGIGRGSCAGSSRSRGTIGWSAILAKHKRQGSQSKQTGEFKHI
jgi:hypothetical protein